MAQTRARQILQTRRHLISVVLLQAIAAEEGKLRLMSPTSIDRAPTAKRIDSLQSRRKFVLAAYAAAEPPRTYSPFKASR
eukprot:jgi/Hompol1/4197/HPOL_001753-RA